jgi:choice-of-anchor A domain-containing protein/pilin isopeptide linkage protein
MNKILRKYAVLLFGLAMIAPNTLQINADTNIQPSTDTYTGRGGSYDLSYILNNYNFFVKNNVSTGHTMGAAVAGGDCAIGNSAGIVANQPYKQTADSFIGGRLTAATPPYDPDKSNSDKAKDAYALYMGNTSGWSTWESWYGRAYSDAKYLDIEKAFSSIDAELTDFEGTNTFNETDGIKNEGGNNYSIDGGQTIRLDLSTYTSNGNQLTVKFNDKTYSEDTIIWDDTAGTVSLDSLKVTKNGANLSSSETNTDGTSLVYVFPNATSVSIGGASTPFYGHIVAPKAAVTSSQGNFNGCIVASSLDSSNSEGHMWPYKGKIFAKQNIKVNKIVTGTGAPSDELFSFKLAAVTAGAPMPSSDTASCKAGETAEFGNIKYTQAGIYKYTVVEKAGSTDGMTYDTDPKNVTVTVTNTDNVLKSAISYGTDNASSLTVTNNYTGSKMTDTTASISVNKKVEGSGAPDELFSFKLAAVTAGAPMPSSDTASCKAGETAEFGNIKYTQAGTYYYSIQELNGTIKYMTYSADTVYAKVAVKEVNNELKASVTYGSTIDSCNDANTQAITNTYKAAGTVSVTKHSVTQNGKKLQGCGYILYKMNGNVAYYYTGVDTESYAVWSSDRADAKKLVTDVTGTAYASGLEGGSYYFREVQAPAEHLIDTKPIPVILDQESVNDSKTVSVWQADQKIPTNLNKKNTGKKTVNTGDGSNISAWLILMLVSLSLFSVLLLFRKKCSKES